MAPTAAGAPGDLNRFQSLWKRCLVGGAQDTSTEIHQRLINGYNEPQRRYHTFAHIKHCLSMFDQCKSLTSNPDALEIAIWFHDAIFVPGNSDNEALSSDFYRELSAGAHTEEFRELAGTLIMATLHEGRSMENSDARYMVDIDLSSFGLPWENFLADSRLLREEHAEFSDADYYRKQAAFRTCLLGQPHFYQTDFFRRHYEQQARENLEKYSAQLKVHS